MYETTEYVNKIPIFDSIGKEAKQQNSYIDQKGIHVNSKCTKTQKPN